MGCWGCLPDRRELPAAFVCVVSVAGSRGEDFGEEHSIDDESVG